MPVLTKSQSLPHVQASDTLFLLDYVGPPGFAVSAARHAGR